MNIDTGRIFKHFSGMDNFREEKKREFAKVNNEETYAPHYIRDKHEEIQQEIIEDRKERAAKALEEVEKIETEMQTKKFKSPQLDSGDKIVSTNDQLLLEMQLARKLDLLKAELPSAETTEDFQELMSRYGDNEHFYKVIMLDLERRAKDSAYYGSTLNILNKEPEELHELSRIKHTIKFLGKNDMHPNGLDKGDYKNLTFEKLL